MNQGTYSAECSLDSVGKYPNLRKISTRTLRRSTGDDSMISASRGYKDWPSCSKRSTKAWWLKPAVRNRTRSGSAPTSVVRNDCVSLTEWHRPNTRLNPAPSYTAQGSMAIGLL